MSSDEVPTVGCGPLGDGRYVFRFGSAEFDAARNELRVGGCPVKLEPRPRAVLALLLRHAGEVVTKAELLDQVWGQLEISEQVVPNAVAKLRRALGASEGARIVTVARFGYRFDGPVERIATGRRMGTRLALSAGQAVPGHPSWRLERQLGAGASEVWLARHGRTSEPRVFKFCSDGEQLSVLKREVTILRLLEQSLGQREDFVRLLGWNLADEPFFLELEYGGQDLLAWAEHGEHLRELTLEDRLDLFLRIADAVAAAHEIGVLHKDLKPRNVLIGHRPGARPSVKIADFGSSHLLDPQRLEAFDITRMGMTVASAGSDSNEMGTPLYLAPELFSHAPPTVRSDLYALGVMLYQLVVGSLRRPLATDWKRDVDDPLLREDIAASTAGQPERRLGSVVELTERLRARQRRAEERLERDRQQQRAAAAERALERARIRRPWLVTAAAALLAGTAASLMLLVNARQSEQAAVQERARAAAINRFLIDDILASGMLRDQAYEKDLTMREVLQRAAQQLEKRFVGEPATESSIALTLAGAFLALGQYEAAETLYRRAVDCAVVAFGPHDPQTVRAQYRLSQVLSNQAHYQEAGEVLKRADTSAAGLSDLHVAIDAADARSTYHFQQLQIEPALAAFQRLETLLRESGNDDAWRAFNVANGIAQCLLRLGRHADAEARLTAMLADPRFDSASIGSRAGLIKVNLGRAIRAQGRSAEALDLIQVGYREMEQARGPDDYLVITALGVLGQAYNEIGDASRALEVYEDVYQRMARRFGADNERTLAQLGNLGITQHQLGRVAAAIDSLSRAESSLSARYGDANAMTQTIRYFLALAYGDSDTPQRGLPLVDTIDPAALQAATAGVGMGAKLDALRGKLLLLSGRERDGRTMLQEAIHAMEQAGVDADTIAEYRALLDRNAH
ncbi:MAG: tetratricopeptide repeat protein [Nevskiales bacterium]|nr:tetratricopeptide repeat protein [Nevskiales bacterium]